MLEAGLLFKRLFSFQRNISAPVSAKTACPAIQGSIDPIIRQGSRLLFPNFSPSLPFRFSISWSSCPEMSHQHDNSSHVVPYHLGTFCMRIACCLATMPQRSSAAFSDDGRTY